MHKRPLKYRELRSMLKKFDVHEAKRRGKGSERIFIQEKTKKIHTIRCHGEGDEISIPVINSLLKRFNIDPDDFWPSVLF